MTRRGWKTCSLGAGALLLVLPGVAAAGDTPRPVSEVVVTGNHGRRFTALRSPVPIDVVRGQDLAATGFADLAQGLEYSHPSVNFAHAQATATSANVRPFTLRGLAPDQVLVLVNGRRWHASAVLNANNAVGRGTAPYDLNTIPAEAIARVEVLRDGAAAEYGSDAIAGVVNIILKDDREGAGGSVLTGVTERGDGQLIDLSGHQGLAWGDGHVSLTGEARFHNYTDRGFVDSRSIAGGGSDAHIPARTYRIGDPRALDVNLAVDAGRPVGSGTLYATAILSLRDSMARSGFRTYNAFPASLAGLFPGGIIPQYPMGYLPRIRLHGTDAGVIAGYRWQVDDATVDLSQTFGYNRADLSVENSINFSLGPNSPSAFDSGGVTYGVWTTDLDYRRPLFGDKGALSAALQYRHETYAVRQAEAAALSGSGADSFIGFAPAGRSGRDAFAFSLGADAQPLRALTLGAAVRYDHYDDFGGAWTGKADARLELSPALALRAAVSTGFKAPSMPQLHFNAVAGRFVGSPPSVALIAQLPVDDPIAISLGARPLGPERSHNQTFGLVFTPTPALSVTADAFRIRIRDRLALSQQYLLSTPQPAFQGITFFVNGLDTTTTGFDVTARYGVALGKGRLALQMAGSTFRTRASHIVPNPVAGPYLDSKSIYYVTDGQPRSKGLIAADYVAGRVTVHGALTAFGKYVASPLPPVVQTFGARTVADASVSWRFSGRRAVVVGVQNLGDAYPDTFSNYPALAGGAFRYGEESPFGVAGRTWYVRLTFGG